MLPLILVALGIGAVAIYAFSGHDQPTADAALAHQVADAHLSEAAQATQQADQHAAQQQMAQAADARNRAAVHAQAAHTANTVVAQKVAQAAPLAQTDRERRITALQADLVDANNAKIAALASMRQAADLARSSPGTGQAMQTSAQAGYMAAQEKVRTTEAALRQLGVNPLSIPAPARRDEAR